MTTYTVFADNCEEQAPHAGLGLDQAFAWVLECCHFDHVFERRPNGHALILWDRRLKPFAPHEIATSFASASDARVVLMLRAIDGRFSYRALSDERFRERLQDAMTRMAPNHGTTRAS